MQYLQAYVFDLCPWFYILLDHPSDLKEDYTEFLSIKHIVLYDVPFSDTYWDRTASIVPATNKNTIKLKEVTEDISEFTRRSQI